MTQLIQQTPYRHNKARIIIESQHPQSLAIFKEKGFRTSYYIVPKVSDLKPSARDSLIMAIKTTLRQHPELELSSDYRNYNFLRHNFPLTSKNSWIMMSSYDLDIISDYQIIRSMLRDSSVKTVLTPYINFNRYF